MSRNLAAPSGALGSQAGQLLRGTPKTPAGARRSPRRSCRPAQRARWRRASTSATMMLKAQPPSFVAREHVDDVCLRRRCRPRDQRRRRGATFARCGPPAGHQLSLPSSPTPSNHPSRHRAQRTFRLLARYSPSAIAGASGSLRRAAVSRPERWRMRKRETPRFSGFARHRRPHCQVGFEPDVRRGWLGSASPDERPSG